MSEPNQNNPQPDSSPFNIVYNYRTASTKSSKTSKNARVRKLSDFSMQLRMKKSRKMTDYIQPSKMLEQKDERISQRYAVSQSYIQPEERQKNNREEECEKCCIWDQPQLDRIIPFQINYMEFQEQMPFKADAYQMQTEKQELFFGNIEQQF